MSDDLPRSPERVRDTYDRIAEHFAETRHAPWPEVTSFLDGADGGGVGIDVGCGNGRHLPPLLERVDAAIGVDTSPALLSEAGQRVGADPGRLSLLLGEASRLPISSDSVDVGLYVATLPHLWSRAARVRSLRELGRVLAPDGVALVSAWSTAHERFEATVDDDEGFDTTVEWTLPGAEMVPRFYHIYSPAEFEADLERAGLTVEASYVSSGNCYAEVRP